MRCGFGGVVWGAQAASLLSSAACRRLPRVPSTSRNEYLMNFSAGCRKEQAGSLCSPETERRFIGPDNQVCSGSDNRSRQRDE